MGEGALQLTLECMEEVNLGRGLNVSVICVRFRVLCGRGARLGARGV